MKNRSNYDKRPSVTISHDESQCAGGWDEVNRLLAQYPDARRVAIECYPGVLFVPLLRELVPSLQTALVMQRRACFPPRRSKENSPQSLASAIHTVIESAQDTCFDP